MKGEILDSLRSMVLSPDDRNRSEYLRHIADALAAVPMPQSPADPYVARTVGDASWLERFEQIPPGPGDADFVLANSMRALSGQMRWHSSLSMHNVTPPILLAAGAAHAVTTLFNPNALWDLVSGDYLQMERQLVRQLARLMGWQADEADGLTTFGGKAGIMYAVRLGLNRCLPGSAERGLAGGPPAYVVTTDQNHYSTKSSAALLGLGRDAVIEVPTRQGVMCPDGFEAAADDIIASGGLIACVVLCGGNTLDGVVDPVVAISAKVDSLVSRHDLTYRPWLHLDLPLGWPWLTFREYDFDTNPLEIPGEALDRCADVSRRLTGSQLADSTCFDFHKLGLAPYSSSIFLTRWWRELRSIFGDSRATPDVPWFAHGTNMRQHHSIEHSRSAAPIPAVWVALQTLGMDGFRVLLGHLHDMTALLRQKLAEHGMEILNPGSPSLATMFVPARPGERSPAAWTDDHTETIFRRASGLSGEHPDPLAIGFVPGYQPLGGGAPRAALRIYLANPLIDESAIDRATHSLAALGAEVAAGFAASGLDDVERFVSVPK
jgi:glutamate/tyrosine decarboxylase-like PLP-dependent enzyme